MPNYDNGTGHQPRPTVINAQSTGTAAPRPTRIVNPSQEEQQLKGTVVQSPNTCPQCGYPVVGNFTSCPNCGGSISPVAHPTTIQHPNTPQVAPVSATLATAKSDLAELGFDEKVKCEKCGAEVSIEFTFCPMCSERIHLPTVRAIRHKPAPVPEPAKPHCHLTLIPENGELTEPVTNDYEGAAIILTRENTEASNRTITSKEQAELTCEDGKWFLQNKSELGSTYLEAGRKLELQQGDIIVLGDRRFKFEAEK